VWWEVLRLATIEVFSMMAGVTVVVPEAKVKGEPAVIAEPVAATVLAYVTGVIGIAGAVHAIFSMRCTEHAATAFASQMLGISATEAEAQKADAIGEICNMIAGNFKHKIGLGSVCHLTVPTVVVGGNYSIHCLQAGQRIELPVMYEGEVVLVALDIQS
jgi:chemotaxis protein CheX